MDLYSHRKLIQKLYDDSVYGNIKGDVYKELSELRIDNKYIIEVSEDRIEKRITFKLDSNIDDLSSLLSQINSVIKAFIEKNMTCMSEGLKEFLSSGLFFDTYIIKEDGFKIVIIQL